MTDPYSITDELDRSQLETIVQRLEARARHPFFVNMLNEYLDAMSVDPATRVLDVGCGSGRRSRKRTHPCSPKADPAYAQ